MKAADMYCVECSTEIRHSYQKCLLCDATLHPECKEHHEERGECGKPMLVHFSGYSHLCPERRPDHVDTADYISGCITCAWCSSKITRDRRSAR